GPQGRDHLQDRRRGDDRRPRHLRLSAKGRRPRLEKHRQRDGRGHLSLHPGGRRQVLRGAAGSARRLGRRRRGGRDEKALWLGDRRAAPILTHSEPMKVYCGGRSLAGAVVTIAEGGQTRPLDPRYDLKRLSPTGFEWTYEG